MVVNVPSLSASARSSGRVDKRWQSFLNYQLEPPSLLRHKGPADWPGASAINLRTGNAATGLEPARLCRSLLLNGSFAQIVLYLHRPGLNRHG